MDQTNVPQLEQVRSLLHTLRQQDSTIDSDAEFFQSNGDQLTNFIDTVANNPQGVKSFLESTNDPAFAAKLLANSKPEERPGISFLIDNQFTIQHHSFFTMAFTTSTVPW